MLARSVPCVAPPRFGQPSRFRVVLGWHVPGAIAFVLAVTVSVGSLVASMHTCDPYSNHDTAKITAQILANEAWPQWQRSHGPNAVPQMRELFAYMDSKSDLDPWGDSYVFGGWTPRGQIVVVSRGEDRVLGTTDDIRSDQ
jgi:hypothetical protein